jgi:uncharacterized protein
LKQNLIRLSIISLLISLLCSGASFAQSFDCAKAESEAEKLICGSDELKRLDLELAKLYKEILSDPNKNKTRIRYWQRNWLKYRDIYADFRDLYNYTEAHVADAYRSRIIEFSVWQRETSQNAAINTKSKWGKDKNLLLTKMYETYKKDGFDQFYRYGADRESCTELLMEFMKLNFEPVTPVMKTNDPSDTDFKNAMGSCGGVDLSILCINRIGCFRFSSYKLYSGNFDGNEENGEEIFLIAETPNQDNLPLKHQYFYYCEGCADPAVNGVAAALLLNPYDNCSREANRDWRARFYKNGMDTDFGSSNKQGSVHALWYTKLFGETLHYYLESSKYLDIIVLVLPLRPLW